MRVRTKTLDSLASRIGLRHIDLLKIDTEGAELKVLAGAGKVLRRTRKIVMEIHPTDDASLSKNLKSVKEKLEAHGFTVETKRGHTAILFAWRN